MPAEITNTNTVEVAQGANYYLVELALAGVAAPSVGRYSASGTSFTIFYTATKRVGVTPSIMIYNPTNGAINSLVIAMLRNNVLLASSNLTVSSFWQALGSTDLDRAPFESIAGGAILTPPSLFPVPFPGVIGGDFAANITAFIRFHYVVDARIGIV